MFDFFITKTAYAADDIYTILAKANQYVVNPIIKFMFIVASAFFLYGVFEFLYKGNSSADAKTKGQQHMFWGIIGLMVMFGVFGIINLIMRTVK